MKGVPVLRENYDRNSISEFLNASLGKSSRYSGLAHVIQSIAQGAVRVNEQVQQAALADVLGTTGDTNVQGEIVQRLDAASSDIFVDELSNSGKVAVIGCEEIEDPVVAGRSDDHAYIVLMDPLDGSSNIDVAVSIGSIFGIWKRDLDEEVSADSLLKPGNEQVAAVYVVYGSSTVMVAATENSVQGFTLDPATGQFFLTNRDIVIPEECPYYSTNEGNFEELDVNTRQAVSDLRNRYSLRYVGSLVADFHRNLLKGGIFLYPADTKRPEGRLRLMYEANPLGFVAEQAGGAASTGYVRIMDVMPEQLHQRTPLILGNKDVVNKVVQTIGS
ncbi:MAG: class 1 fructose-bisphosphatase [SAR202 cluster bacterium]|nr:class 1 fructose-bisphosphatase [SAR202 cluster bacterium]